MRRARWSAASSLSTIREGRDSWPVPHSARAPAARPDFAPLRCRDPRPAPAIIRLTGSIWTAPSQAWAPVGRYDAGFSYRQKDGQPFIHANCAGGIAFGPGYGEEGRADPAQADQFVWIAGDSHSPRRL